MSLFMIPFNLLFLNDGRMGFAKFKINKGISTFVPISAYGRARNIPIFRYRLFKLIKNTQISPLLHFKCTNECDLLCVIEFRKPICDPPVL